MQKKPRLVKPKPKSKPKSRASKPAPLRLTLEDELLVRLDALVPKVGCSAAAREFGIVADRHLVARVALLRGLSIMEAGEVSGRVAPPPALHGGSSSPEPEARPMASTSEPPLKAKEVIVVGEDGLVATPEGWNRWGSSERIPAAHTEVHEYYTANGWERFWGRAGDEVIAFYWSPDPELQGLSSYKSLDKDGKEIKLQDTPFGPGHMIPHGWAG